MKKVYLMAVVLLGLFSLFYFNCSFALNNMKNYIKVKAENITKEKVVKTYEVSIENQIHTITYEGLSDNYKTAMILKLDGEELRSGEINEALNFQDLKEDYINFNEKNFYFLIGKDNRTYLAIRFGSLLTVLNSNGKKLEHKPFEETRDSFDYLSNYSYDISENSKITLYTKNDEDAIKKYFYKNDIFTPNDGYVSLKLEDNKIYNFMFAPDLKENIVSPYNNIQAYLYENEYVIYNDEIYYKTLNKYEVNFKNT